MKWNKTLSIIALFFLIINFLFTKNAETLNGGRAMIYIFIFPLFWIGTLITVGVLAYKKRKKWFSSELRISTIILLALCSPLSILGFSYLTKPEIYLSGTGYNPKNGITIKTETWNYNSGKTSVRKFWKINTENYSGYEENEYKKDSIWIYYNKNGDTLKIEKYKNDKLIEIKETKK
jgi:hypothetical protein|tara:strand:+ start:25 stop:555 length:531 start_codon:yes stop_codon:yes gene_type:complete